MTLYLILIALFALFGMPIAFAIGIPSFLYFVLELNPVIGIQRMASSTQAFPLLAVPFFVFAGAIMNESGITSRLMNFATKAIGWVHGGLAQVTVLLSAFMGGVSGAAVADAAMQSRIFGSEMETRGFTKGFTGAAIGFSALITSTIPPSIGLILYGFVGNVSIGKLFLAGIIPGLIMAVAQMGLVYVISRKRGYLPELTERPTRSEVWESFWDAKWALLFPVILVGGIRFGVFTPSEAGAFAVVYALGVGWLAHGDLKASRLWTAIQESVEDIGMIMLVIMFSAMLSYVLVIQQAPQSMTQLVLGISDNPNMVIFILLIFLLLAGLFVDASVNTLLLTPILVPIVTSVGIDPVHFGVLMMITITMGIMTPPLGVGMFAVCGILKCDVAEFTREALPFVVVVFAVVIALAFFPSIVLFLPNILMP